MSWAKKFGWSGLSIAAAAVMALTLLTVSGGTVSAAANGISAAPTTIDQGATSAVTIDADAGDTVQIVSSAGTITVAATSCNGGTCNITAGASGTANVTVTGNAGTTDTVTVTFNAPATGPATATITALVGTSSKSTTVTVRGLANTVELSAFNGASTSTSVCQGTDAKVIRSTTATQGLVNAQFCILVKDASGTRLANQAVVLTTTAGTLSSAADVTGATGQRANAVTLGAGTTGTSGTTATVTASSGGKSATIPVKFGGDPATCTITANPATVQTGGSSVITIDVKDGASTPGPVPDTTTVNVQQTNPGAGTNAAILNAAPTTIDGKAATTLIAAIPGAIALGASSGPAGSVISCTASVQATGTVVNPGGGGGTGTGGFTGTAPARGSIGLLVTSGASNAAGLVAALGTAGCPVESLAILEGGVWKIYINGAPAVVNAAFPASIPGTTAFFVRCA